METSKFNAFKEYEACLAKIVSLVRAASAAALKADAEKRHVITSMALNEFRNADSQE